MTSVRADPRWSRESRATSVAGCAASTAAATSTSITLMQQLPCWISRLSMPSQQRAQQYPAEAPVADDGHAYGEVRLSDRANPDRRAPAVLVTPSQTLARGPLPHWPSPALTSAYSDDSAATAPSSSPKFISRKPGWMRTPSTLGQATTSGTAVRTPCSMVMRRRALCPHFSRLRLSTTPAARRARLIPDPRTLVFFSRHSSPSALPTQVQPVLPFAGGASCERSPRTTPPSVSRAMRRGASMHVALLQQYACSVQPETQRCTAMLGAVRVTMPHRFGLRT